VSTSRSELHTANRVLELGAGHPSAHGSMRLLAELDGEQIVSLQAEIGLGHRGFEKACEQRSWYQIVPWVERLNPDAAPLVAAGYCQAVEALLALDVPARGRWMRVVAGELARIGSHFGRMASMSRALQATTPAQYALQARERVRDLLEALSGARSGYGYVRIGGVARATPADWSDRCRDALGLVERGLRETDALIGGNRLFVKRLAGTGVLSREACLAFGVTGPSARAAGWARDLRKQDADPVYGELDFEVAIGRTGDNLDRYLVLVEEVRQSLRIVEQCLDGLAQMTPGAVASDDSRIVWPARGVRAEGEAALSAQTRAVTDGPLVPAGEVSHAVESANGEVGFHLVADGSGRPVRVRCRAPSFFHVQALGPMMRGAPLADVMPTLELLGIAGHECDR
jgi:NADH-quinone oxidoreductase subunit D